MTVIVWVEASYPAIETLSDWIWIHSPLVSLDRSGTWTDADVSIVDDELLDSAEHPSSKRLHMLEITRLVFWLLMIVIVPWEISYLVRESAV